MKLFEMFKFQNVTYWLGIYNDGPYDAFIDTKKVSELKRHSKSPLEIGGGMALNDVMDLLKSVAHNDEAYEYGNAMVQHIRVVRYR